MLPLYNPPTVIVTTDDGTLFSCEPMAVGGTSVPGSFHWRLIDVRGLMYIGPAYSHNAPLSDVERIVSDWWEKRKLSTERL